MDEESDTLPSEPLEETEAEDETDFAVGDGIDKSLDGIAELISTKELMIKEPTLGIGGKGGRRRIGEL